MCVYAGVRMSVMIPWCPNSWPDDANWFTLIAKLFAIFPLHCTEADSGLHSFLEDLHCPLRQAQVHENNRFHMTTGGVSMRDLLTCREDPSALMMHELQ